MLEQPNLDNWDDFAGDFLKVENVKEFPLVIVPTDIFSEWKDNRAKLSIEFLYGERNRKLGLNKTMQTVIKKAKLTPKQIIGKKLTFGQTKVRNPTINEMVDGFVLISIDDA